MDYTKYSHLLPQLSKSLSLQIGLFFPKERWSDLVRGLEAATSELGFEDTATCMQWLLTASLTRNQIETLAGHLTVGETYFFREEAVFNVLRTHILPKLIESRRFNGKHLRIWSAGCSTGEEAYSLAILVQQMIPDFQQWNISILGTDINPHALKKASAGIYSDWSFRSALSSLLRKKYFRSIDGGHYEITPQIKSMVTFSYLNLAEDAYPSLANYTSAMDIIFCRNLLMYFEPDLAAKVVGKHYQALVEGGWLIVSPSEISQASFAQFSVTHFPNVILHQKISGNLASETKAAPQSIADILPDSIGLSADPMVANDVDSPLKTSLPTTDSPFWMASGIDADEQPNCEQAFLLYANGSYEKAAQKIAALLAIQPDNTEAMTLMIRMLANQGNLSLASQWYERLITTDKLHAVGHYLMATVHIELRQIGEAMRLLKLTLYLDQDFVLAHFSLGNLCRQQGLGKDARKHFNNALLLLGRYSRDTVIPESDGVAAGQLIESIQGFMNEQEQVA